MTVNWSESELKERLEKNRDLRVNRKYSQKIVQPDPPVGAMKYRNQKTTVDEITFDSIREANEYQRLKFDPEVIKIELQPEFELQPAFDKDGIHYRAIIYRADFRVTYRDGRQEIIDTKGFKTKEFRIKHKMFEYKFPELRLILK